MRVRFAVAAAPEPTDLVVDCPMGAEWRSLSGQLARHGLPAHSAYIDGVKLAPDSVVGMPPLVAGAEISFRTPPTRRRARWSVQVVSGPAAGIEFDVPAGRAVLGRGPSAGIDIADPEVSRTHAELEISSDGVSVRDLGSANGTALDGGLIRLGASSTLRVVDRAASTPVSDSPRAGAAPVAIEPDRQGNLVVNVPPRPRREPPPQSVDLPGEATGPMAAAPSRLSWVSVLTPLLVALPLAVAYGARLLVVTLLAPVAALFGWAAERTRCFLRNRGARQAAAAELGAAMQAVTSALAAERRDRVRSAPEVAALLAIAERDAPGLWHRRPGDPDFLRVRIGTADMAAALAVRHSDATIDHPTLTAAPVTVSLADGQVVGIVGPRARVLALARFLVAQVAVLHAPSQVGVTVASGPHGAREWSWTRWLARGESAPITVTVVDDRRVRRADRPAIYLAEAVSDLPAECDAIVEVVGREATRLHLAMSSHEPNTRPIEDVVPDLVPAVWAERCARALAPLRVATGVTGTPATLPDHLGLSELLGEATLDSPAIDRRWRSAFGPCAVIGVTASGPYVLDLRRDGPHVLVAGTTGAGKSELLRTLIASLALGTPPDRLAFVLIDYKGGAAFGECTALPHTVGLLTDLDQQMTERALTGLNAELRRRERLFAEVGAADLDGYVNRVRTTATLARLVIVVDEFATLVEDLPDFVSGLVSIARRGRSLGIHLVLATQRPAGVVTGDIRANMGLRIALRLADAGDSTDVVGVPSAAGISARTPGRAIVRTTAGGLVHIQTALVGGQDGVPGPLVRAVRPDDGEAPPPTSGLNLAEFAELLRTAAARRGVQPTNAPWTQPLPVPLSTDALEAADREAGGVKAGVRIGLIDRLGEQQHAPLTVDLDTGGHWLVAGGPASGKTTLVRTVIAQVARSTRDDAATHVYVVATDDGLADAAALWQCGAVVAATDGRRLDRVFARLREEIDRRRRGGRRTPRLLLTIDGWGAVADTAESVEHGRPLATLLRLLRDGQQAGLTVVITGDRSVLTSRISAYTANRLILRLDDVGDYASAGLSPRTVPVDPPPGRGILAPAGDIVQIALPAPDLRQIAALQSARADPRPDRPFRVEPLPNLISSEEVPVEEPMGVLWAPLGVGGDDLRTVGVDLAGRVFLVAGGRRSGRTTVVRTISEWLSRRDVDVVAVTRESADDDLAAPAGRPTVLVADDAEAIIGTTADDALVAALRRCRACGVVLSGLPDTFAYTYRGITAVARHDRCVLLLGPPAAADTELAGERLSKDDHPPAGRGILVVDGAITDVQVAMPGGGG